MWQDGHVYIGDMTIILLSLSYSQEQLPELNNSTSLDGFKLVLVMVYKLIKLLQLRLYLQVVSIYSPWKDKLFISGKSNEGFLNQ